jgi:hypothetical protein
MRSINRAAIVVRPKPSFFAWAATLDGAFDCQGDAWTSVYLVSADDTDPPEKVLRESYTMIFEEELESWHRRESDWPQPRSFELFQQWFHAEVVDLVLDLTGRGIQYDD